MAEEFDFFFYARWDWGVVGWWVGVADDVEGIQVDDDERKHCEALLVV